MEIDREEACRRLSYIIDIHMYDEDNETHRRIFKEAGTWDKLWDTKTDGVKELQGAWLDWITGVTDEIRGPA